MESSSKMVERRVVSVTSSNEVAVETNAPDKWEYQERTSLLSYLPLSQCDFLRKGLS